MSNYHQDEKVKYALDQAVRALACHNGITIQDSALLIPESDLMGSSSTYYKAESRSGLQHG